MTKETLVEFDNQRPFQPYSLRLNNGDVIRIGKPDHCLITEDEQTLVFNERGGRLKVIAIANITRSKKARVPKLASHRGIKTCPEFVAGEFRHEMPTAVVTQQPPFFFGANLIGFY